MSDETVRPPEGLETDVAEPAAASPRSVAGTDAEGPHKTRDEADNGEERDDSRAWIRFAVTFGVFALIFEVIYNAWALESYQFHVFLTWLASGTGLVLEPFYDPVRISDTRVSIPGFVVDVDYGCDAVQVCTLLASAVLAFPSQWSQKLTGLVVGIFWMQGWNIVRIATLVVVGHTWGHNAFEMTHVYIWPTALIAISLLSWIGWVRWALRDG